MTAETANGQGDAVATRVRQFIVENFFVSEPEKLRNDESLITGGFVDSTGLLEVIAFLEAEYGIRIDEREMVPDNLETVDRIATFVATKRSAASGCAA